MKLLMHVVLVHQATACGVKSSTLLTSIFSTKNLFQGLRGSFNYECYTLFFYKVVDNDAVVLSNCQNKT